MCFLQKQECIDNTVIRDKRKMKDTTKLHHSRLLITNNINKKVATRPMIEFTILGLLNLCSLDTDLLYVEHTADGSV